MWRTKDIDVNSWKKISCFPLDWWWPIGLLAGLTAFRSRQSLQSVPLPQNHAYFLFHASQARLLPIAFLSLFWLFFWQKLLSSGVQQEEEWSIQCAVFPNVFIFVCEVNNIFISFLRSDISLPVSISWSYLVLNGKRKVYI